MLTAQAGETRRIRRRTYLYFLVLFAAALFVTHAPMLGLPFHWDELGQFVPAARDLWLDHALVPHSAVPNAHPPAVMAWMAGVWTVFGYSVAATRAAMLALASVAVLFAFLLAIELGAEAPGAPAFAAAAFLSVSPLFFAQSVMAQLDVPAMLLASIALLCFFRERMIAAAIASTVLVLVKETGLLVPAVLGAWLIHEKRYRDAALFAMPLVPLAAWFAGLKNATGHTFGSAAFTEYNLFYPLHPVRLPVALARRLWALFGADFQWVGTAALLYAWRRTRLFASRPWKVAWLMVAAHVVALCLAGGAMLERYLLPVLPLVYAGMAAAMMYWPVRWRRAGIAAMTLGLAAGNFWNPPYPFPMENNLAWTDMVRVQRTAARYLEQRYPDVQVATAWPLAAALQHPEFGYVTAPLRVQELPDLYPPTVGAVDWDRSPVFVLFCHTWDPRRNLFRLAPVRRAWMRFWNYREDVSPREVQTQLPLRLAARWSDGGWWVEVYERAGQARGPAPQ
jgi:4-amino-4-deoxy-L-arabinose transferase-like glycosyltransferase